MTPERLSGLILSVLLSSAAILAVFVTIGARVEKAVVQRQTSFVIERLLKDHPLLGDAEAPLAAFVGSLEPPDMRREDAASAASNAALLRTAVLVVGGCLVAGLLGVRALARRAGFSFAAVLRHALLAMALAAGTEVAFLLCIAQHHISADPQAVRLMILEALQRDAE